jgi:hypothetical protein
VSVYFVTCREANAVKIGFSVEPRARLPEIQWGCPLPLTLEAIMPGDHQEEARLHRWFEEDRITGEWFRLTDMLELVIANNAVPHLAGLKRDLKALRKPRKRPWRGMTEQEKYDALMAEARRNALDLEQPTRRSQAA